MAMGIVFRCNACPKKIEAWDEGHPYYVNELGKKCTPITRTVSATSARELKAT